jgi:hypothetical protein
MCQGAGANVTVRQHVMVVNKVSSSVEQTYLPGRTVNASRLFELSATNR